MEATFVDFFKRFRHLKLGDLRELYRISQIRSYQAGEMIVREGECLEYAIGIIRGSIRTYVMQSSGVEKTVRLCLEKELTGSSNCLLNQGPSFEYLHAVEDCVVVLVDAPQLQSLADHNIRLMKLWNVALSEALADAIQRVRFFVTYTPEERYQYILEEHPALLQRVPQKYLASYLGITTVSLSRIKARMGKRKNNPSGNLT